MTPTGETPGDDLAVLFREREARSLVILSGVGMAGFAVGALALAVQMARLPDGGGAVLGHYMGALLAGIFYNGILFALVRRRLLVGTVGLLIAIGGACMGAGGSLAAFSGLPPELAAPALLVKMPVATAGIAAVAAVTLTLRPLYVAITGGGTALTMLAFVAAAARDPATRFTPAGIQGLIGPEVSVVNTITELSFVLTSTVAAAYGTAIARRTVREALAAERATGQLSRYFSPNVAAGIVDGGVDFLRPGGREQEVVVLFSDLADFTRASAGTPAAEVLALLSAYQERMVAEIFSAGGTSTSSSATASWRPLVPRSPCPTPPTGR